MGIMVSGPHKPEPVMSTDSRTRCEAGHMLAAEDAGVVFAFDYCKVCERVDVLVVAAADPAALEPEIRKYGKRLRPST